LGSFTDLVDEALSLARRMGADETVNVGADPDRYTAMAEDRGRFDVAFEATGVAAAIEPLIAVTRPGGRFVQVGMLPPGEVSFPVMRLMAKEIDYLCSFRFNLEFATAVAMFGRGLIDVAPILTQRLPFAAGADLFHTARDRGRASKVHAYFDHA